MKHFNTFDLVILLLVITGGINWGLVGLFDLNLVSAFFGEMSIPARITYIMISISSIYAISFPFKE